jgi:hypothetical protein
MFLKNRDKIFSVSKFYSSFYARVLWIIVEPNLMTPSSKVPQGMPLLSKADPIPCGPALSPPQSLTPLL